MALLKGINLEVRIGETLICRGLNLEIEPNQCWGILGRNGVGKTTLLHTLAGLRAPMDGDIQLMDKPLGNQTRQEIAQRLGVLLQDSSDPFPANVLETALIGRHPHLGRLGWNNPRDYRIAREALAAVGLEPLEARQVDTLSGGERQRLSIATLLTQAPKIALLDEPTNHLDLHQQISMLELLLKHLKDPAHGLAIILHDINLALRYCDQLLLLLGDGEYLAGPTKKLATEENLTRLYSHPLTRVQTSRGEAFLPT